MNYQERLKEIMSMRDEEEARRMVWFTRLGWSVVCLGAFAAFLFLVGIWVGDERINETAAVFLVPAIIGGIVWGVSKMEDSF